MFLFYVYRNPDNKTTATAPKHGWNQLNDDKPVESASNWCINTNPHWTN